MSGFDFSDLNRLAVDMSGADRETLPAMRAVLQKGSADIKRDAQALAPVDTGNLRSSITYETHQLVSSVRAEIGPTADYGVYVELGTSTQAPQPYMGPAFDRNAPAIEAAAAQIATDIL